MKRIRTISRVARLRVVLPVTAVCALATPTAQGATLPLPNWTNGICNQKPTNFTSIRNNCFNIRDTNATPDGYTAYFESAAGTGIEGLTKAPVGEGEGVLGFSSNLSVGVKGISANPTDTPKGTYGVWGTARGPSA